MNRVPIVACPKTPCAIICSLIQATQRDPVAVFEASNLRRPRPPADLGVHTDSHETFAPLAESGPPLQRKALHNFSIASMQPFGEENRCPKLNMPYNTD
ncbi:hypothetical protein Bca52824_007849 [Brassica carinata]|uniref:Uncharacterized protein n=1 Tax=Brassica carinata TaxID=52824 RepID=A0A8X7W8P5_BRACI|nr:hypothetical protein Bca52824_007849 [Brassica carinata]